MLVFPIMGISGVVEFEKKRMYEEVAADNEAMPKVSRCTVIGTSSGLQVLVS
jgi:hypothetical protein